MEPPSHKTLSLENQIKSQASLSSDYIKVVMTAVNKSSHGRIQVINDGGSLSSVSYRTTSADGTGNPRSDRTGPLAPGECLEPARSLCPVPQPGSPAWHQDRPEAT